ncbi:type II secretion system F family protein [Pseudoroseicyclus tamaricis]|uniref:Type II secretion system F family protein n=1 Tax=Pseudoroseicyclus tamaricis TaxID=2705421 RepID=A0A6B2K018_9RHOB|nr:type II secretion system F family protein [Pseudoroseicyclus tamaricis]NDV01794.1 type II secretion system F family protein [Pseudoroseicyclus tamaricis]
MLQTLNDTLIAPLGPLGPVMLAGAAGIVLILVALAFLIRREKDPLDKLKDSNTTPKVTTAPGKDKLRAASNGRGDKLERYSNFLEPQSEEEFSASRLKLLQAGYRSKNAVRIFHFSQFAMGIGGLILGIAYTLYLSATGDPTTRDLALYGLGPGVVGYMLPKYWVNRRQQERKQAITNGFPDSLDMMLVCVEAGQSLDQSIIRVARELRTGFPELSEEYEMVAYEMKAGKDKTAVLRDMAERCGVADVTSFVTVLIQSQQFGTSIAEALRVYAGEMRDKRVMRAEEKANTLPTKMTLATMMLTVPPLLIILIGPSVWDIYQTLGGGGAAEATGVDEGHEIDSGEE